MEGAADRTHAFPVATVWVPDLAGAEMLRPGRASLSSSGARQWPALADGGAHLLVKLAVADLQRGDRVAVRATGSRLRSNA
jgi:hypothetical protein